MKAILEGYYKGVRNVSAGSFTNDKGTLVNYPESYKLIFDQIVNNIPKETILKIDKQLAYNISPNLKPYDKINITCDITIYSPTNVIIKILDVKKI